MAKGMALPYSCLENPMDRRACQAAVCGVRKSWTQLKQFSAHLGSTDEGVGQEWQGREEVNNICINDRLLQWTSGPNPTGDISRNPVLQNCLKRWAGSWGYCSIVLIPHGVKIVSGEFTPSQLCSQADLTRC